jgi:hypothetical protein
MPTRRRTWFLTLQEFNAFLHGMRASGLHVHRVALKQVPECSAVIGDLTNAESSRSQLWLGDRSLDAADVARVPGPGAHGSLLIEPPYIGPQKELMQTWLAVKSDFEDETGQWWDDTSTIALFQEVERRLRRICRRRMCLSWDARRWYYDGSKGSDGALQWVESGGTLATWGGGQKYDFLERHPDATKR